jgi:hypothetical protein
MGIELVPTFTMHETVNEDVWALFTRTVVSVYVYVVKEDEVNVFNEVEVPAENAGEHDFIHCWKEAYIIWIPELAADIVETDKLG